MMLKTVFAGSRTDMFGRKFQMEVPETEMLSQQNPSLFVSISHKSRQFVRKNLAADDVK